MFICIRVVTGGLETRFTFSLAAESEGNLRPRTTCTGEEFMNTEHAGVNGVSAERVALDRTAAMWTQHQVR